jgi:hypothetical protein
MICVYFLSVKLIIFELIYVFVTLYIAKNIVENTRGSFLMTVV